MNLQPTIKNKTIVSGITATGHLTIGNYIGAIQHFLRLQNDNQLFIFVANLHALTTDFTPAAVNNNIKEMIALYYACGLDPAKVKLFIQSAVPAHSELAHILLCHTTMGELSRMTQYKDKKQKYTAANGSHYIPTGLLTYPCLMAADILLYDADYVPVGSDQKQHIELTRNIAQRMNKKYKHMIFNIPAEYTSPTTAKIRDLQDPSKKMSKSANNPKTYIKLLDDQMTITRKIKAAKTDSENKVYYNMADKPGISNLIAIYSALAHKTIAEVEELFKKSHYGEFKQAVADIIWKTLEPIQKRYQTLLQGDKILTTIKKNTVLVNKIAKKKLHQVQMLMGLTI